MGKLLFELTNEQRKYLGLIPVEEHWELVRLNDMYLYFDNDVIRKKIVATNNSYIEQELCEKTSENRTILLPKTARGKPKKLNFTATQSFSPFGVYFNFLSTGYISIANYTTQTTFFSGNLGKDKTIEDLKKWIDQWIAETTEEDLSEIESFKSAKRQHCKFKEGDFFIFKIGRRNWGFGRILIDIAKLRKDKNFRLKKNYGLDNFMGKALIVKIYHKIADTQCINLNELSNCTALPAQPIMDNHFYYGENKIIGHKELNLNDYSDMLISYGRSISSKDRETVYLQYGLIFKEANISKFDKYLVENEKNQYGYYEENPYRNESIGFGLDIEKLEQCIAEKSNQPYWNSNHHYKIKNDLRNPKNISIKREIFSAFGLDADKSYAENLKLIKSN
ncbi:immunity 26/phosphotriesterase HocA family protein [Leminorella grimontii]|uniref:immunity 26/phosphotriesterase HocA family protein n=1 Tax=Leminorella grimontii TaxID=82981 RepID=UPI0032201BE9